MRRFNNVVRWKEFWHDQKQSTKTELNEENEESRVMATSLSTGLKPMFGLKTAKHGSKNLKVFLTAVERLSPWRLSDADVLSARTKKTEKSTKPFIN